MTTATVPDRRQSGRTRRSLLLAFLLSLPVLLILALLAAEENRPEALHHKAKAAGVVFIKITGAQPEILQKNGKDIRIIYTDEIIGQSFRLRPDLVVVDETIEPSAYSQKLAKILRLESDCHRFCQADNVHRLTVSTNRKGVFLAVGGSKGSKVFDGPLLTMKYFFDALDVTFYRSLLFKEIDAKGDILKHPNAMGEAFALGKEFVEDSPSG